MAGVAEDALAPAAAPTAEAAGPQGHTATEATVAVLPPTLLVMLVQQNLIKGLTLGAVKG